MKDLKKMSWVRLLSLTASCVKVSREHVNKAVVAFELINAANLISAQLKIEDG